MLKVLREGVHRANASEHVTRFEPICSSSILIQSEGRNILVDPGHIARADELRELLAAENLTPEDIHIVFLTHHHLDHSSNMGAFPKAKIFIGNGFVTRERPKYLVYKDPNLSSVPELEFPSNVKILPTPGHTGESTSLVYEENGLRYVCAGDSVREDVIREGAPTVMYSREKFFESLKKIFEVADVIIPGHGRVIEGKNLRELRTMINENR